MQRDMNYKLLFHDENEWKHCYKETDAAFHPHDAR